MLSVDLVKQIKSARVQKKVKQPVRRGLFERIGGLVKQYSLGENFLRKLDNIAEGWPRQNLKFDRGRAKEHFEPPLFSLLTEEEYRVTMEIMKKVNNPYLQFANSPDEILLCGPFFSRNPSLEPDQLARYHFEALLLRELANEDVRGLKTPNVNQGSEK